MNDFHDFGFTSEKIPLDKPIIKTDSLEGMKDIIWPFIEIINKTNPKKANIINSLQQKIEEYIKEKNESKS